MRTAMLILGFVAVATGCEESAVEKLCDQFSSRLESCTEGELGSDAVESVSFYCEVSMSYELPAGASPDNLAEVTRVAIEACAGVTACGDLHACLERNRCGFVLIGPDDPTPEFYCW